MEEQRQTLRRIFDAALVAVAPDEALRRHLRLEGAVLSAGGHSWNLAGRHVYVLGAGKGAAPMAHAVEEMLGALPLTGFTVVKYDHGLPLTRIELAEAGHPVPDAAGEAAARRMLDLAKRAGADDLVLCLFTGGASALTPAPAQGLCLEDVQQTTAQLLACGATIYELNAVRKHLSLFSGGLLARAAYPAPVVSIIVSDVVGDPLDVIASGPTAPDPSTFADCLEIVGRFALGDALPAPVLHRLREGAAGRIDETPKADDPLFTQVINILAATNRQALDAAAREAEACGYAVCILSDKLTGEAQDVACELVAEAVKRAKALRPGHKPMCLLAGGETTVTIKGSGKGGRNQEMALTAALALEGTHGISCLFAGTDGTDGPTDAAGGFAFASSVAALGGSDAARAFLENNNSYAALAASNDLLITGPTRTNVMDIAAILLEQEA